MATLNNLPDDILEKIYKMVHNMMLSEVHCELLHRMCSKEIHKELIYQHLTASVYDSIISVSDPFLCLPCHWEVQDVITDEDTQGILREIQVSKLRPWCRTFSNINGFLGIDDYLRYQNSLF